MGDRNTNWDAWSLHLSETEADHFRLEQILKSQHCPLRLKELVSQPKILSALEVFLSQWSSQSPLSFLCFINMYYQRPQLCRHLTPVQDLKALRVVLNIVTKCPHPFPWALRGKLEFLLPYLMNSVTNGSSMILWISLPLHHTVRLDTNRSGMVLRINLLHPTEFKRSDDPDGPGLRFPRSAAVNAQACGFLLVNLVTIYEPRTLAVNREIVNSTSFCCCCLMTYNSFSTVKMQNLSRSFTTEPP